MIVFERLTIGNRDFIRTYSDSDRMIERDGVRYTEAIDPAELGRTYTEAAEMLPEISAEVALNILLGGNV